MKEASSSAFKKLGHRTPFILGHVSFQNYHLLYYNKKVIEKTHSDRPWAEVVTDIIKAFSECRQSPADIARLSGVNYQAVRRMIAGKLDNRTRNAEKLCYHFQIPLTKSDKIYSISESDIMDSVREVWDGSPEHASLIIKLVLATKGFR